MLAAKSKGEKNILLWIDVIKQTNNGIVSESTSSLSCLNKAPQKRRPTSKLLA